MNAVDTLVIQAHLANREILDDALDEAIIEVFSQKTSAKNNEELESRIRFLIANLGFKDTKRLIAEAIGRSEMETERA